MVTLDADDLHVLTGLDGEWCYDEQQSTEQRLVFLRGLKQQHQRTVEAKPRAAGSTATFQKSLEADVSHPVQRRAKRLRLWLRALETVNFKFVNPVSKDAGVVCPMLTGCQTTASV